MPVKEVRSNYCNKDVNGFIISLARPKSMGGKKMASTPQMKAFEEEEDGHEDHF